ncbi:MAG: 50S ribosomal protein L24 [Candidatus Latescibacteria bacterium]|jgi:large subunit ribosomal protein L24|nr:50S ribosomal protein L24 [Candidatus Latescibacterota bacterium]
MRNIIKGDRVIVISGEDRGKEGVVLKIDAAKNRAIVEGINFVKHHQKPTQKSPQGGIAEKEAPVNLSNLMAICGKCNAGVKTKTVILQDGGSMRACKRCGEIITSRT